MKGMFWIFFGGRSGRVGAGGGRLGSSRVGMVFHSAPAPGMIVERSSPNRPPDRGRQGVRHATFDDVPPKIMNRIDTFAGAGWLAVATVEALRRPARTGPETTADSYSNGNDTSACRRGNRCFGGSRRSDSRYE